MRIVITGGAGFLGTRLARALLARGTLTDTRGDEREIREIVLLDLVAAPDLGDKRVRSIAGDLADPAVIERALTPDTASVFHLAAVVSGQAEADFDLGMRVNVDATRLLLERCRRLAAPPKFVFTSSLAVFGGSLPDPVPDDAPLMPQTSYGAQKAIGEYLVYDMTRKGMLDGRSLRLPTVTVRPGKPNKAASSFASGIIREPLAGVDAPCPVAPTTRMWVTSPGAVVANLIRRSRGSRFRVRADALGERPGHSRRRRRNGDAHCVASRATRWPRASSGNSIPSSIASFRRGPRTSRRSSAPRWGCAPTRISRASSARTSRTRCRRRRPLSTASRTASPAAKCRRAGAHFPCVSGA